jgi:O-succinylbenzoic acid--CoA ligase
VFNRRPLPGVSVTSSAESASDPGILTVAGPTIALGYRADAEATATRFTPAGFVTSDLGFVREDGTVIVIGRADDIVIINGVNVSPAAVDRVIADLPDVVAAATVVGPSTDGDPRLFAFLEVRDAAGSVDDSVREAVQAALGKVAIPVIRHVPRLPHLPNGKVDRRELQSWTTKEG